VILIQVAEPFAAKVREPVVPAGDKRIVSVVMAIVTTPAPFWLMNVMAVPMGKATELLAGIVNVLAVVSAEGCKMCLPESARTSVYAADRLFCGMFRKPTASVPSTVQLLNVPLVGVPKRGVTKVGEVAKTATPVPVSSDKAVDKLADVNEPNDVARPTEVTAPVRFPAAGAAGVVDVHVDPLLVNTLPLLPGATN
jgi:hypothetical protein